ALTILPPESRELRQHAPHRGPAVAVACWEVRTTVEDIAVRREKRRERPTALAGHELYCTLVTGVDGRALGAGDLDRGLALVDERGNLRIVVGLRVHDVTPVAPHCTDVEKDRPVLASCTLERFPAPRHPVDGLCRPVLQERARLAGECIACRGIAAHSRLTRGSSGRCPSACIPRSAASAPCRSLGRGR